MHKTQDAIWTLIQLFLNVRWTSKQRYVLTGDRLISDADGDITKTFNASYNFVCSFSITNAIAKQIN